MSIQQFTQRLEAVLRKEILGVGSCSRRDRDVAFEKEKSSSLSYNNNAYDYNGTIITSRGDDVLFEKDKSSSLISYNNETSGIPTFS